MSSASYADPMQWPLADQQGKVQTTLERAESGKLTLLNIWASWCSPCVQEIPALLALAEREPERINTLLVNVDTQMSSKEVLKWWKSMQFKSFPILFAKPSQLTGLPSYVPETYLFKENGQLLYRFGGAFTDDELDEIIALALDE